MKWVLIWWFVMTTNGNYAAASHSTDFNSAKVCTRAKDALVESWTRDGIKHYYASCDLKDDRD